MGLPDLAVRFPAEVPRVEAANVLYAVAAKTATYLTEKNIMWSMENPRDSLYWHMPCMVPLTASLETHFAYLQHCAYGGERPKWTAWFHFPGGAFADLAALCPGESA